MWLGLKNDCGSLQHIDRRPGNRRGGARRVKHFKNTTISRSPLRQRVSRCPSGVHWRLRVHVHGRGLRRVCLVRVRVYV